MKTTLLLYSLTCMLTCGLQAQKNGTHNVITYQETMRLLSKDLTNGTITHVDILYVPEHIFTRASITPEWIEKNYRYKLIIRDIPGSKNVETLGKILLDFAPTRSDKHYDMRWACLFFDVGDRKKYSIYFDPRKKGGMVNGELADFNDELSNWLGSNYRDLFK